MNIVYVNLRGYVCPNIYMDGVRSSMIPEGFSQNILINGFRSRPGKARSMQGKINKVDTYPQTSERYVFEKEA
jgi:hypothetical protein